MIRDVQIEDIKTVAIYLRKSRGDEEVSLDKHRELLVGIAKTNEWSFETYEEIGSGGGSIDERSEMVRLLDDIDEGMYDAVLVFDQDRLSRGGTGEQSKMMWHLSNSGTKLVTGAPFAIYDPSDEAQEEMMRMKSFFSEFEHRQITKRFRMGKKHGESKGLWLYGTPPFGYAYNRNTKKLKVHPEEGEVVLRIIKEFVHMYRSTGDIAWGLNKDGVPSRKKSVWTPNMVRSVLIKDTYLGNTTYNKTMGTPLSRAKNKYSIKVPFKRLPESEWKIRYNTHEALMTQEEYEYIHSQFNSKRTPRKTNEGDVFDLSGICVTPDNRGYTRGELKKDGDRPLVPFTNYGEDGKPIPEPYKSVSSQLVREAISKSIETLEAEISNNLTKNDNSKELSAYKERLKELEATHDNTLSSFKRINIGFAEGVYDSDEATEMKQVMQEKQDSLETEIRKVRRKMDNLSNVKNEDRLERVRNFMRDIKKAENSRQLNMIYKTILHSVVVSRLEDREVVIQVNFI